MSDRYGLILVRDLTDFRDSEIDRDTGEPICFLDYGLSIPWGLKDRFEYNVVCTPFQMRIDSIDAKLKNIINHAKKVDSGFDFPKVIKLETIKKYLSETLSESKRIVDNMDDECFPCEWLKKEVNMLEKTLNFIEEKEKDFPHVLIGLY